MDDRQKYQVISRLQRSMEPKEIADDVGVSYGSVLKLRRDFEAAKVNGTIDALLDTKSLILSEVGEALSDLPSTKESVVELTSGLDGLQRLGDELQRTALSINTQIRSLMLSVDNLGELEVAAEILCKLQTSFMNKNTTQVNIQNNLGGNDAPRYTQFLGDKPRD